MDPGSSPGRSFFIIALLIEKRRFLAIFAKTLDFLGGICYNTRQKEKRGFRPGKMLKLEGVSMKTSPWVLSLFLFVSFLGGSIYSSFQVRKGKESLLARTPTPPAKAGIVPTTTTQHQYTVEPIAIGPAPKVVDDMSTTVQYLQRNLHQIAEATGVMPSLMPTTVTEVADGSQIAPITDKYGETWNSGIWPLIPGTWSYIREQQMYEVFVNIDGYYHRVAVDSDITPYHNGRLSSDEAVNGLNGSSFTAVEVWGRRTSINTSDRKEVSTEAHYWANKLVK